MSGNIDFKKLEKNLKTEMEDEDFRKKIQDDAAAKVPPDQHKTLANMGLEYIAGGPHGAGTVEFFKKHGVMNRHIKPFCAAELKYLKENCEEELKAIQSFSAMYNAFGSFWPDCDALLTAKVEAARKAEKERVEEEEKKAAKAKEAKK